MLVKYLPHRVVHAAFTRVAGYEWVIAEVWSPWLLNSWVVPLQNTVAVRDFEWCNAYIVEVAEDMLYYCI